jgi:hypothetical protein
MVGAVAALRLRVRIIGLPKSGIVGKSRSVLIVIDPIIFTRTRTHVVDDVAHVRLVDPEAIPAPRHTHRHIGIETCTSR